MYGDYEEVVVRAAEYGEEALCAIVRRGGQVFIQVNARYPEAEAHARRHVERGDTLAVCGPECDA